jgi:ribosomal protein S12 methylthiotransferase accessory factor
VVEGGPDWSAWPSRSLCAGGAADDLLRAGSTARVQGLTETWAAIEPLLALAGITRVADLTGLDDLGIPTAQAVRPGSVTLSVSQGKAPTMRAAYISAAMESLEGWHCESQLPHLRGITARQLAGQLSYDPADVNRPAGSIYHQDAGLDWVRATGLVTGRPTWVPLAAARVNFTAEDWWDPVLFTADSNGLASGNTYNEAALHGLYEVLERDSRYRSTTAGLQVAIDPDTVTDPTCAALIERMRDRGNDVIITDHTRWQGLYCFDVLLRSRSVGGVFGGCGLHHDPAIALARALTEAAQSRLTLISGTREDIPTSGYDTFGHPTQLDLPVGGDPMPTAPATRSISARVALVEAAGQVLQVSGIEPVAAVMDFPGACVPVVRVLAPTLRDFGSSATRQSARAAAAS